MRNPSGQLADPLHFLSVAELFFQLPPFSNVLRSADYAVNVSRGVTHGESPVVNPTCGLIRSYDSVFLGIGPGRLFTCGSLQHPFAVSRMNGVHPITWRIIKTFA